MSLPAKSWDNTNVEDGPLVEAIALTVIKEYGEDKAHHLVALDQQLPPFGPPRHGCTAGFVKEALRCTQWAISLDTGYVHRVNRRCENTRYGGNQSSVTTCVNPGIGRCGFGGTGRVKSRKFERTFLIR